MVPAWTRSKQDPAEGRGSVPSPTHRETTFICMSHRSTKIFRGGDSSIIWGLLPASQKTFLPTIEISTMEAWAWGLCPGTCSQRASRLPTDVSAAGFSAGPHVCEMKAKRGRGDRSRLPGRTPGSEHVGPPALPSARARLPHTGPRRAWGRVRTGLCAQAYIHTCTSST